MDLNDGWSEISLLYQINSMSIHEFRFDNQYAAKGRIVNKNADKFTKPFASPFYSGHFNFSYGKYLLDAGYDTAFTNFGVFTWEEPY